MADRTYQPGEVFSEGEVSQGIMMALREAGIVGEAAIAPLMTGLWAAGVRKEVVAELVAIAREGGFLLTP